MVNHEQIIFKKEPLTKQIYYSIIIKNCDIRIHTDYNLVQGSAS